VSDAGKGPLLHHLAKVRNALQMTTLPPQRERGPIGFFGIEEKAGTPNPRRGWRGREAPPQHPGERRDRHPQPRAPSPPTPARSARGCPPSSTPSVPFARPDAAAYPGAWTRHHLRCEDAALLWRPSMGTSEQWQIPHVLDYLA